MTRFNPAEFSLVIADEAHHAVAPSQRKVLDYYRKNPKLRVLGLTATPDRCDEEALGQVFEDVAFEYDILEGINGGWLVPIQQQAVYIEGLDLSNVRTTAGDLNGKDLAEVLEYEQTLHEMTTPILEMCGDCKTLVFTASVAQAERWAEIFNRHKSSSAEFVSGETPKEYRRDLFERYADSRFQYLVNVGVATEGFDEPGIQYVVMARPTKSRSLFAQMAGRGTRPLPGVVDGVSTPEARKSAIAASGKAQVIIVDFVGNAGRHKLIHATDVLGGKYSDEIVELAQRSTESASIWCCEGCGASFPENPGTCPECNGKKFREEKKSGKPADIASELVKAEREIDRRRRMREEARQREAIRLKSQYTTVKIDPFDALDLTPCRIPGYHAHRPATDNQRRCIDKEGYNIPEGLNFFHASQIIEKIMSKPSKRQTPILARGGFPTDVTRSQASQFIDAIVKNQWKPLPKDQRDALIAKVVTPRQEVTV
jgi:superfamily II DNA or RNA helicase